MTWMDQLVFIPLAGPRVDPANTIQENGLATHCLSGLAHQVAPDNELLDLCCAFI
jgi:hypothetical protein